MAGIPWANLRPILIMVINQFFGTMVAGWFDRLLPPADKLPKVDLDADGSPEDLGQFIRDMLYDLIDKHVQRPLVARLLKRVVDFIQGAVLDAIWDNLFKQSLVATPVPVRSAMTSTEPIRFELSPEESAKVEEELARIEKKTHKGEKMGKHLTDDDTKEVTATRPPDANPDAVRANAGIRKGEGEGEKGKGDGDPDPDDE